MTPPSSMRPWLISCLPLMALSLLPQTAAAQSPVPPQVVSNPPANYPPNRTEAAHVVLTVTVGVDGLVSGCDVTESGGHDFDVAAQTAVLQWKFTPALRDGAPFAAKVKVPFAFVPPELPPDGGEPDGAAGDAGVPEAAEVDAGTVPPSVVDAGPPPAVVAIDAGFTEEEEEDAGPEAAAEEVSVRGALKKAQRGGSDFEITQTQVAALPVNKPSDMLALAPGIFIANEGGAGHADQVFLRGFDAEQGQAIEFTVNGVPINEVDNTDGHGYADTHFIIPEVVKNLRVIEGPFDPHQGDFAEAGSADYQLGVTDRRIEASGSYGNYASERLFLLWAPQDEREGTFAAAQFFQSAGFGSNRASAEASAMAQYEGELGNRGLWRVLLTAYGTHFKTPGVIREDDYQSGKVGFYGTEDPDQGGDAQRFTLSAELVNPVAEGTISEQAFITWRTLTLLEDFTGFLLDTQQPGQSSHPQRGDGIEQDYTALTVGDRASYKRTFTLFGEQESLEAGFYGRYDHTTPEIQRVRYGTQIPYAIDEDMTTDVVNLAGYLDADLKFFKILTLRGGIRQEFFDYNIENLCATAGDYIPNGPLNETCPSADLGGSRLPAQKIGATGQILEPKGSATVQLPAHFSLTASAGIGAQSLDAVYITQDEQAPFSQITAWEAGATYQRSFETFALSGRAAYYDTHVGQDLVFNPDLGRLGTAPGTTRLGVAATGRLSFKWLDESLSFTYAHATFDAEPPDYPAGTLVPYVPQIVARSDTSLNHVLPWRLLDHPIFGTVGFAFNYVGVRALPYSQEASPTAELDASASARWSYFKVSVVTQNLTNQQYALSEFFYASNFNSRPYPTLVPSELFTAAPPRITMVTLSLLLDKESDR